MFPVSPDLLSPAGVTQTCRWAVLSGVVLLAVYAAFSDAEDLRIPNWVSLALVALFPIHLLNEMAANGALPAFQGAVVLAVSVLVLGFLAFAKGWIGGGDAKFCAAAALWAGPLGVVTFVQVTCLAGAALAFFKMSRLRGLIHGHPRSRLIGFSGLMAPKQLPYGVAIAAGLLAALNAVWLG